MTSIRRDSTGSHAAPPARAAFARAGGRRLIAAAMLAGVVLVGAPRWAPAQLDAVVVKADASGLRCVNGSQEPVAPDPVEQTSATSSLSAQVELNEQYCAGFGGGVNHELAQAAVEVETAKLRVFASVVNSQFDNPDPQLVGARDLFASAGASLSTRVFFDYSTGDVPPPRLHRFHVVLTGFVGANPGCGLADFLPPLAPPCAEAVLTTSGTEVHDARTGERLGPAGVSISAGSFDAGERRFLVDVLNFDFGDGQSLAPLQLTLDAEVRGRGLVSLRNTATLYVELPEGATFLGNAAGNLGAGRSDFVVRAGQAIPAPDGSLVISPASGVLAPGQAFDLVLIAQTAGQTVVGGAATFDGLDISAPLHGCLSAHAGALALGTPGLVLRCPGLDGSLLGPGTHTLAVTLTLSGGGTLTDTAVWEVPGAAAPAPAPRLAVSPATGPLAQNQAFDLVLFLDAPGREIVGGQILFDDVDVTVPLATCLVPTVLPTGQLVLRCPGLAGAALGLGTHVFRVSLFLSDGSLLEGGAVWEVLAATGT